LLMLSYGVHELGNFQKHYLLLTGLAAGIVICMKLLFKRLTTLKEPLIDLSIFRSPSVVTANGVFFLLGSFFTGYLFIISLLLQKDMNFSAAKSGLLLVPFSILSAVVAKFALPPLMKRFHTGQTGFIGMTMMLIGAVLLIGSILTGHSLFLILLSAAFVSGLGMTISYTSLSVLSIQDIPSQHYGLASSLATTSYFLGAGIGLSILTLFMTTDNVANAVTPLSVVILGIYAFIGLSGLVIFIRYYNAAQRRTSIV